MLHAQKAGKNIRLSYAKIKEALEMPNLIEVQKDSYKWFIEEGLKEVFNDISPIKDHAEKLSLEFYDYKLEDNTKYSVEECKERDVKYAAPLRVNVRLINNETGEIKEQEIFMGEFPIMTEQGTFIINGAERVIVSQLVRSPGIYFEFERDKNGKPLYKSTVIPYRGAWLEYETDSNDVFSVRLDRTRKLPMTVLLRAMGLESNGQIIDMFGDDEKIRATLDKDVSTSRDEALLEIYKKLRPGEPLNVENAESLITNMLFDPKRYDLARVGRYKYNLKLQIKDRIKGFELAQDVVDPRTGEILANAGDIVSKEQAEIIDRAGVNRVEVIIDEQKVIVFSNDMVYLDEYVDFDVTELNVKVDKVRRSVLEDIIEKAEGDTEEIKRQIELRIAELSPKHITIDDIFASINYCLNLAKGTGSCDDIDHLGNRRLRCVGELLQNQFRIGLSRMERTVRERMSTQELEIITPSSLINIRPIIATINEF
ncbi:MAG: DNA-directed RNA polymerase subunit beta, partial [Clostridiales bacterium]|nr:DNA-directed RNA polymerase subunit beta [Clostridiales bacterium]